MGRSLRAKRFEVGRGRFWDSDNEGSAGFTGQTLEISNVLLPFAGMQPAIVAGDV
jgi:hypothetical protein